MKRKRPSSGSFRRRYAHGVLWLTWAVYFLLYFLTENLIPAQRCHVIHCALDDRIPFCEFFVLFYVGWYALVAGSLLYYYFRDIPRFRQLDLYIFITQLLATVCYVLYPSRQELRPEAFPRENLLTGILGLIYRLDTNTGVCPSLHVAYSLAIFSVVSKDSSVSRFWKGMLLVLVVLISLSTAFVKQHSMVDVFAAVPTALAGEFLIYHTKWGRRLS